MGAALKPFDLSPRRPAQAAGPAASAACHVSRRPGPAACFAGPCTAGIRRADLSAPAPDSLPARTGAARSVPAGHPGRLLHGWQIRLGAIATSSPTLRPQRNPAGSRRGGTASGAWPRAARRCPAADCWNSRVYRCSYTATPSGRRAEQWMGAGPRMPPVKGARCVHAGLPTSRGVTCAWAAAGIGREARAAKPSAPRGRTAHGEIACAGIAGDSELLSPEPVLLDPDGGHAGDVDNGLAGAGSSMIAAGPHSGTGPAGPSCIIGAPEVAAGASAGRARASCQDQTPGAPGYCAPAQGGGGHCGSARIAAGPAAGTRPLGALGRGRALGGPRWSPQGLADTCRPAPIRPPPRLPPGGIGGRRGSGGLFGNAGGPARPAPCCPARGGASAERGRGAADRMPRMRSAPAGEGRGGPEAAARGRPGSGGGP